VERKPSLSSYGHHRKTSIVHGIQHSRGPSYNSASASPISPEIIASAGSGSMAGLSIAPETLFSSRTDEPDSLLKFTNNGSNGSVHTQTSGLSTIQDDDELLSLGQTVTKRSNTAHKKMPSNSKLRREHSHSRAHSKHHQESKTAGEYALHHLFNSVCTS
jgi:hypothetical protein